VSINFSTDLPTAIYDDEGDIIATTIPDDSSGNIDSSVLSGATVITGIASDEGTYSGVSDVVQDATTFQEAISLAYAVSGAAGTQLGSDDQPAYSEDDISQQLAQDLAYSIYKFFTSANVKTEAPGTSEGTSGEYTPPSGSSPYAGDVDMDFSEVTISDQTGDPTGDSGYGIVSSSDANNANRLNDTLEDALGNPAVPEVPTEESSDFVGRIYEALLTCDELGAAIGSDQQPANSALGSTSGGTGTSILITLGDMLAEAIYDFLSSAVVSVEAHAGDGDNHGGEGKATTTAATGAVASATITVYDQSKNNGLVSSSSSAIAASLGAATFQYTDEGAIDDIIAADPAAEDFPVSFPDAILNAILTAKDLGAAEEPKDDIMKEFSGIFAQAVYDFAASAVVAVKAPGDSSVTHDAVSGGDTADLDLTISDQSGNVGDGTNDDDIAYGLS